MKWIRTAFACMAVTGGFMGCSKDHHSERDNNGGGDPQMKAYAQAMIKVEMLANEMEWLSREVLKGVYEDGDSFFDCAFYQRRYTDKGEEITLTFDGTCEDNTARKGVLTVVYNEHTGDMTINPTNYTVDGARIEGSFTFANIPGQVAVRRLVTLNGKMVPAQGRFIHFAMDRSNRQIEGGQTPTADDDVFDNPDGTYSISVQDLGMMEGEVLSGLMFKHGCHAQAGWMPVSGKIRMTTTSDKTGTINFGNGSCDKESKLE